MGGLRKVTKVWSQNFLSPSWNSNRALPEYKSSMSLLHQPVCWHVWRTVYHNLCFILFAKSEVFWPFLLSLYTYITAFVHVPGLFTQIHILCFCMTSCCTELKSGCCTLRIKFWLSLFITALPQMSSLVSCTIRFCSLVFVMVLSAE
jgi:hypothetical protein